MVVGLFLGMYVIMTGHSEIPSCLPFILLYMVALYTMSKTTPHHTLVTWITSITFRSPQP